jgi:hypothetical protein
MGSRIGIYAGNINSKMANDVNIIAVVFFSALSLIHLNTCMHEAADFAKSHFKKVKSSHVISVSGRFLIPE